MKLFAPSLVCRKKIHYVYTSIEGDKPETQRAERYANEALYAETDKNYVVFSIRLV